MIYLIAWFLAAPVALLVVGRFFGAVRSDGPQGSDTVENPVIVAAESPVPPEPESTLLPWLDYSRLDRPLAGTRRVLEGRRS